MFDRTTRILAAASLAFGVALAVAACGSDERMEQEFTISTSTSEAAPTASAAPVSAAPASAEPPTAAETPQNVPASPPTAPTRDDATVDAQDYAKSDYPGTADYAFRSPTGKNSCVIYSTPIYLRVGCQTDGNPPTASGVPCPAQTASSIHITEAGIEQLCSSQSVYRGVPAPGSDIAGGRELGYGDTIIVQNFSCTSSEQGMTCFGDGHSFRLSADESVIYS